MGEIRMSSFELKVNTDNSAFAEDFHGEMKATFDRIMDQITRGDWLNGKWSNVRDTNGNTIGTFKVINDEID
jgi:hypothetical protein